MLFSFADLEPRRQAENELRHSEERFVTTFRLAPIAMAITTCDEGTLCDTNDAFHQLTGWSSDEAMGKTMQALNLWKDATFLDTAAEELNERTAFRGKDATVRTQEGGLTECLVSAASISLRRDTCILWVIQDIHQRRHSELELIGAIEAVMKDTNWFSRTVVEKLANLRAPHGAPRPVETSELTIAEAAIRFRDAPQSCGTRLCQDWGQPTCPGRVVGAGARLSAEAADKLTYWCRTTIRFGISVSATLKLPTLFLHHRRRFGAP